MQNPLTKEMEHHIAIAVIQASTEMVFSDVAMYSVQNRRNGSSYFLTFSGSSNIPSASSLRRASSKAQVCILAYVSIGNESRLRLRSRPVCIYKPAYPPNAREKHRRDLRGIRLEDICNTSNQEAANKSVIPNTLPAFFHVLVAWLDAEQPPGRRVVVITMVCSTETGSCREVVSALGLAQQTARTKDV